MRTSPNFSHFDPFEKFCVAAGTFGIAIMLAALVWSAALPH
jgi:hypothetical protein